MGLPNVTGSPVRLLTREDLLALYLVPLPPPFGRIQWSVVGDPSTFEPFVQFDLDTGKPPRIYFDDPAAVAGKD